MKSKKDYGPFVTTTIMFFLAEMGDKTQIATVALGAQYDSLIAVVLGTTLGMMLANVPAVFFGDKVLKVVPMQYIRWAASVMFVGFGVWQIINLLK
ncbi:TMEM165/GDT1 family protein [Asticcacaulis sp. SL142]|uniref:TMEM165/GDT1 family protein n=1 Tax=Asticcacaulis sp. SL142 TaxID=2995155 RepID=UPI00226CBADE|nr:TMEM165/GDT1 family protein [Asticcacaulis sp. SL142]WAC49678.1 TMEM165/GDT1 family protein [Asticcacaulis sp. SL142]